MKEKQDHKNIIKMKRIYYILISVAAIAVIGVSLQFCKKDTSAEPTTVAVTSVNLAPSSLTLKEGEKAKLSASVSPSDATDKTISFSSSSESVATVDNYGNVTAVKAGSAIITAKAGSKSSTCSVTVARAVVEVSLISLNKVELSLKTGGSETLVATVKPDDATDKTVTWSSDKSSVATVVDGKVTAVGVGTAGITAKAGDKTATCQVTVSANVIALTSIELSPNSVELMEGQTVTIKPILTPSNTTQTALSWGSDSNMKSTGDGTYEAQELSAAYANASSTISVSVADNSSIKASLSYRVHSIRFLNAVTNNTVTSEEVALGKSLVYYFRKGDATSTEKIPKSIFPSDGFTVASSNKNVASVEKCTLDGGEINGFEVTPVKAGTATISVRIRNVTKTLAITVK